MRNTMNNTRIQARTFGALLAAALLTATANANLVVRLDGQVIPQFGQAQFPETEVGQTAQYVFTLRNESSQNIEFTEEPDIFVGGGFDTYFEVTQPVFFGASVLQPNESTAFAITFAPQHAAANLSTTVFMWTNLGLYRFNVSGAGFELEPAKMVVKLDGAEIADLASVAWTQTLVGETFERTFEIHNEGGVDLHLTENPPVFIAGGLGEFVFSVTQQPAGTIAPGAFSQLKVRFAPTQARFYSTRLFVYNDDEQIELFDIDLTGEGAAPAPTADCNGNGSEDADDIASGASADCDGNGTPDECELANRDADQNGVLDDCEEPTDPTEPNEPVIDDPGYGDEPNEPVIDDPGYGDEPNTPVIDDPGYGDEPNQPGYEGDIVDPNTGIIDDGGEYEGDGDETGDEYELDEMDAVPGLCGFGGGFFSLMSLMSLSSVKLGRRNRKAAC